MFTNLARWKISLSWAICATGSVGGGVEKVDFSLMLNIFSATNYLELLGMPTQYEWETHVMIPREYDEKRTDRWRHEQ